MRKQNNKNINKLVIFVILSTHVYTKEKPPNGS